MKRRTLRASALAIIIVSTVVFGPLPAQGRPSPGSLSVTARSTQRAADVRDYWTEDRMHEAEPFELEVSSSDSSTQSTDREGTPRTIAPNAASDGHEITNPSTAPYRTHGKVFFTMGGYDYVCSGTVVSSPEGNTVVTAGHCTYGEGDGFATNWAFVPGYKNGNAPYGVWVGRQLFTTQGWQQSEDFRYDLAFVLVDDIGGNSIEETVGSRGISFNQDPNQEVDAIGYPAAYPFTGERMIQCETNVDYRGGSGVNATLGIDCDMTGGSSGGGWVINDQYVTSVVSYSIVGQDGILYGPYFGQVAEALYEDVTDSSAPPGPDPGPDPDPTEPPDPDPTEPPEPPGERVTHDVRLTLKVTRRGANGSLRTPDGYRACSAGATVEIYRVNARGTGIYVGETTTNEYGRFWLSVRRPGRYLAYSPGRSTGDGDVCSEGVSNWSNLRR